jgi:putative transcriptional regulator
MDDVNRFGDDLPASVRQMKASVVARRTSVAVSEVAAVPGKVGASQDEFARMLNVSVRTLQEWGQGRRTPSGAARVLIRLVNENPDVLRQIDGQRSGSETAGRG